MKRFSENLSKILTAIYAVITLIFIGFLFVLNMIPFKYLAIIAVVLILLFLIAALLMYMGDRNKKSKKGIVGKVMSILMSIVLVIGLVYVTQGNNTLGAITGAEVQTHTYTLNVLADSKFEKMKDLDGHKVLINEATSDEYFNQILDELKKKCPNVEIVTTTDFNDLVNMLLNGEVDAILINEGYRGVLEEIQGDFSVITKVIFEKDLNQKVDDFSTKVNVTEDVFTIYISGIDTRGKVSTVSRSDVNMLVTVNPKTKQILMTSIPRDYFVTLANYGKKDKLTHAGLGGVENSVKTIENFMGIEINYYARVNFTSLVKIVDALGGITVNSPVSFTTLHGNYNIVAGDNYMDGEKALGFVRERYSLANGDNDRVKNQQRVLTAMLKKMMSPTIITNYSSILDAVSGSFETNMKSNDITSLIKMQIDDMASWDIKQIQLSGHGEQMLGGALMPDTYLYYMIPNQESVNQCTAIIQEMMDGGNIME